MICPYFSLFDLSLGKYQNKSNLVVPDVMFCPSPHIDVTESLENTNRFEAILPASVYQQPPPTTALSQRYSICNPSQLIQTATNHYLQEEGDPATEEQRGREGVPEEEEGVHQVSGEQSRSAGKSKQSFNRGT